MRYPYDQSAIDGKGKMELPGLKPSDDLHTLDIVRSLVRKTFLVLANPLDWLMTRPRARPDVAMMQCRNDRLLAMIAWGRRAATAHAADRAAAFLNFSDLSLPEAAETNGYPDTPQHISALLLLGPVRSSTVTDKGRGSRSPKSVSRGPSSR